jgi:hypothetical protein
LIIKDTNAQASEAMKVAFVEKSFSAASCKPHASSPGTMTLLASLQHEACS